MDKKKILLIGGTGTTEDMIPLAHRNNIHIGVTDYYSKTYVKSIADAAYEVSVTDVDEVAALCKRENYTGVISAYSDFLSPYVARIADKIGGYVPFDEEQLRLSTDKKFFKAKCEEYGVLVPKEYQVDIEGKKDAEKIEYPVIVKPIDGSGSRGISVCNSWEELVEAYQNAHDYSKKGDVLVEQFIEGDEINITYIAQDGDIQVAAIHDRYFNMEQDCSVKVPDLYIYPSRYVELFLDKFNENVIRMLQGMKITDGSLFLQACVKDECIYIYEAGMRLNGCKTYQILEVENDYNTQERLMYFALSGDMGKKVQFDPRFKRWYATFNVIGKPGEKVEKFQGIEELKSYPWLIEIGRLYHEGETIPENSMGTLVQVTSRIHIYADTKEQLLERIEKVNELYKVLNEKGENILLQPHDVGDIQKSLNYEL